jgi:beta-lactam-binding protein with PASTA domain
MKFTVFKNITKQPFWVNLLIALAGLFLLAFLFLQSLGWITNHGAYLKVPPVKGMKVSDAIKLLEGKGFDVMVMDSVYYDSLPKNTVVKQLPDPDATVKANRTVFLTVNRLVPPPVDMPKLEGLSLRFALNILERNHLTLGDTIWQKNFMKGSVIEQQYKGARIFPGAKVPWGSPITLIIASGLGEEQILVPDLVNKTYAEAKAILQEKGITIGYVGTIPGTPISDTPGAFIYKQSPSALDFDKKPIYIQPGQIMDLYLSPFQMDKDSLNKADNKDPLQ